MRRGNFSFTKLRTAIRHVRMTAAWTVRKCWMDPAKTPAWSFLCTRILEACTLVVEFSLGAARQRTDGRPSVEEMEHKFDLKRSFYELLGRYVDGPHGLQAERWPGQMDCVMKQQQESSTPFLREKKPPRESNRSLGLICDGW